MSEIKKTQDPSFILDCSVTMAWCFEDEMTDYTEQVLDSLEQNIAIVPALWSLEVANVLLLAQRKKRISKLKVTEFKDSLSLLAIQMDHSFSHKAMSTILELAEETDLTIYDATYLELALWHSLPIATLDLSIRKAAKKIGISLYKM